ncbi:MAG: hypothetical protein ACK4E8_00875 [Lacibacter sp.]|jgi:hypothetical protein
MNPMDIHQCIQYLMQWKKEGLTTHEMQQRLAEQQVPEELARESLAEWKRLVGEKKRFSGFLCCGIGGGLLLLSFLITLILFDTEHNFSLYLYGLTALGVSVVFKGLVDLLGW